MNRLIIILLLFIPKIVYADVFKINKDGAVNQEALNNAIVRDSKSVYFKKSLDENITSAVSKFSFERNNNLNNAISQRYKYVENINKQIENPLLRGQNADELMRLVRNSRLMPFQYTAPAEIDLFKYYSTIGQMRLSMFYGQVRELEKEFGGTLDVLRRQGLYDCLKDKSGIDNLPEAVIACSSQDNFFDALFKSERFAGSEMNVLQETLNQLHVNNGKVIEQIKEITPQWILLRNGYRLDGPLKRIGQVFAKHRAYFIEQMKDIIEEYHQNKEIDKIKLDELSLPGVILTEKFVRNLFMMDETERELLISQWASRWSTVKTIAQYEFVLEWFERALIHPSVKAGFKAVVEESRQFVINEVDSFKNQMSSYRQYAEFMCSFIETADEERKKIVDKNIQEEDRNNDKMLMDFK